MLENAKINYIELPAHDLKMVKDFFSAVFAWEFTDYGPEYTAFYATESGLDGGFYQSNQSSKTENGAALVVFYAQDLKDIMTQIIQAGGAVCKDIFEFPGGRRFHFTDPCGNEYAVWSDQNI